MKICIGKRVYGRNKFRWFYCPNSTPMGKQVMKDEGILIFWWFGYNWYFCVKKRTEQ